MDQQKRPGKTVGEYLEELGICTRAQLDKALGYAKDCSKWGRYIPVGQALIELGYANQDEINAVLTIQARDRAAQSNHAES